MSNPLAHDSTDHAAFARAMVACQGYAPACSDMEGCQRGGVCFTQNGRSFKEARKILCEVTAANIGEPAAYWLNRALELIEREYRAGAPHERA